MKAGIITIGDELLLGQTINTNLTWIGKELSNQGVEILKSATIQDDSKEIVQTLDHFLKNVDVVIITGGLGPTNDDLTKETLTEYFNTKLVLNKEVLVHVENIFKAVGKEMLDSNIHQAMLPENCIVLENLEGTAPGMWFEKEDKIVISLPGVPYEMKSLLAKEVIPRLAKIFNFQESKYETLMVQGIGESFLAEKIKIWEDNLYAEGLALAYLPSPGIIRLRISSKNDKNSLSKIAAYTNELEKMLPQYVYGRNDESIFEKVGELLVNKKATVGTIESCTGGGIANAFTLNSGASNYFQGSLVTYSNDLKIKLANVSPNTLNSYGAVSKEVAIEMAKGGKEKLGVDYAIAVTGIAGPTGGSDEKPVGLVWIAIASSEKVIAKSFLFGTNRERNITKTQLYAANLLRKLLLDIVD